MCSFPEQEGIDAEQETSNKSLAAEEAPDHFHQSESRVFLELELQDEKIRSASKMINSMKALFLLARWAASLSKPICESNESMRLTQ